MRNYAISKARHALVLLAAFMLSLTTAWAVAPVINGHVYTGPSSLAEPVSGSSVQLYYILAQHSTSVALGSSTTTDSSGAFHFNTGSGPTFSCPTATPTVPIFALVTGGTASGQASANSKIKMMSFLGRCNGLTSTSAVVNEATTMAAVSGMANFVTASSPTAIIYPTAKEDVFDLAFETTLALADPTTGAVPGASQTGFTVSALDIAKINTEADALYTCTHSTGGVPGDGSACGNLFDATTGLSSLGSAALTTGAAVAATETWSAAFNIATYVVPSITALSTLALAGTPPFTPTWSAAPPDLLAHHEAQTATPTISLDTTVTGQTTVTITNCTLSACTPGAAIFYTTNGSTPTLAATPYLGPFVMTSSTTIKAIAQEAGFTTSAVASTSETVSGPHIALAMTTDIQVGSSSTGTITLSSAAPAGGLAVTVTSGLPNDLSMSSGAGTATQTVTIAAGSTTGSYTVYGTNGGFATITATATGYGQGQLTAHCYTTITSGAGANNTTTKVPVYGLTDVGYSGFLVANAPAGGDVPDNSMEMINADPGVFAAAVINLTWKQLEPTPGNYDFSAIEQAIANIEAANGSTYYVRAKFRIWAGNNVPTWLINQEPVILSGATSYGVYVEDGANNTVVNALYWSSSYEQQYKALIDKIALQYDTRKMVQEVSVGACSSTTEEPFNNDIHYAWTGYNDGTTQFPSLLQAGYTDVARVTCVEDISADYAGFSITPLYLDFNSIRMIDSKNAIFRAGFSLEQMQAWADARGAQGLVANDALQPETTVNTQEDLPIYDEFRILKYTSGVSLVSESVGFQTAAQNPLNIDNGSSCTFTCYNSFITWAAGPPPTGENGSEVEIWPTTAITYADGKHGQNPLSAADLQSIDVNAYPSFSAGTPEY